MNILNIHLPDMDVSRLLLVVDNDRASPPEPVGSFDWRRGEGTLLTVGARRGGRGASRGAANQHEIFWGVGDAAKPCLILFGPATS